MDYEKEDITLQIENEEKNKTKKILRETKKKERKNRTMKNHHLMHIVPRREMTNTSISKQIKKEIIKKEKPKKEKKSKEKTAFAKKYKPTQIKKTKIERREKKLQKILINNHQFHKLKKM